MGLQAIKPASREKKRYLCFKSQLQTTQEVEKHILSQIKKWIGEKNYALGRVHLLKAHCNNGKGIISCNHKEYLSVREGINLAKDTEVFFVSGSLKKAKEKIQEEL